MNASTSTLRGKLDRRQFLGLTGAALAGAVLPFSALPPARAANPRGVPLHGLSAFGELKYAAGFSHFDYASPDAPSGGRFVFTPPYWIANQNPQTFNSLNTFTLRNDAPPRMELCYDSLMKRAYDEPSAIYGLLAETVTISEDGNSYDFALRPEARFSTGLPVTGNDVAYTLLALKHAGHPDFSIPLRSLENAEATGENGVRLTFDGTQSPRNILLVATMPIVSSDFLAYREFEDRFTDPIPGSGRYQVGRFELGRFIEYDRRPDYWANEVGVAKGFGHFDTIRVEFFTEREIAFEAFKKGLLNYREEFTSRTWKTGYDFPALNEGRVVKTVLPGERRPRFQVQALNMRRERFRDERVRRAIALAFDFEWINENIFFGAYTRSQSPFMSSDLMATGEPSAAERALLDPLRDQVPEAVFGEAPLMVETDGSGADRTVLREAANLLREAGWERDGTRLVKDGQPLELEILIRASVFERVYLPYVQSLKRLGIDASLRLVDPAQYANRLDDFDFDMIGAAVSMVPLPTEASLVNLFGSSAADNPAAKNYAGIADPAVDALIAAAGRAETREDFTAAVRALDRVLRANLYVIPSWVSEGHRVAYWDEFGRSDIQPDFHFPVEELWWHDAGRAAAIGRA